MIPSVYLNAKSLFQVVRVYISKEEDCGGKNMSDAIWTDCCGFDF